MMRAGIVFTAMVLYGSACAPAPPPPAPSAAPFNVVETSIPQLQAALKDGRITSHQLVAAYLERIATYEDRLNAIITVNPRALAEADAMDQERAAGRVRGPLHGIPDRAQGQHPHHRHPHHRRRAGLPRPRCRPTTPR